MNVTLRTFCLLLGLLTSVALYAQPANDNCADAAVVTDGNNQPFTTVDATTDGADHANDCASTGTTPATTFNDVWYTYTATFTGQAEWSFCDLADFDTKIYVYSGTAACPPADGDIVSCSEDAAGCGTTSAAIWDVMEGETYLLRVGGYGDGAPGESGSGAFNLGEYIAPMGPPNNFCEDAQVIMLGADQPVDNNGATTDGPEHPGNPCFGFGDNTVQADVWYSFTSPITGSVEWSTCNMVDFDSRMAVYAADVNCPVVDGDLIACNDDGGGCTGFTSMLIFEVEEGATYLMRLGGWNGDQGTGLMSLIEIVPPEPPANDLCELPEDVFVMSYEDADNFNFLFEGSTIASDFDNSTFIFPKCITNTNGGEFGDVWYSFNTLGNTEVEVRFNIETVGAQFYFDLWDNCDTTATAEFIMGDCIFFDGSGGNTFFIDTITGLPDQPTDYLIRVMTRFTSDVPGDFWFQLVGEMAMVGIEEVEVSDLKFFPNPVDEVATLQFNLLESGEVDFDITNLLGQKVTQQNHGYLLPGDYNFPVDVSRLDPGVYILTIRMDNKVKSMKFIKE